MFNFIEQLTYVYWYRTHADAVQTTVEHVGLDAGLVERLGPLTDCFVRIFAIKEVYLFETATVCLNTVETTHFDDYWGRFH